MTNWSEADTKNLGGDHILTQFLTLQASNFTMTQNVLYAVHYISTNHLSSLRVILWTTPWMSFWWWNVLRLIHPLSLLLTCRRPVSSPMCLSERYHSVLTLPSRLCSATFLLVTFCGIIFLLATSFPCYTSVDFPPITVFCCSSGVILPVVSLMSSSRGYVPISSSSSECSSSSSSESLTHLTTVASPVLSPSTVSPIS